MTARRADQRVGLSLRVRLLLPFACGMALLLAAMGAFLYARVSTQLLGAVDQSLLARASAALADGSAVTGLALGAAPLVDPDEAFGQLLDGSGRVVVASPGAGPAPLLGPTELPPPSGTAVVTRQRPGGGDPVRLLAVPDPAAGRVLVLGTNLGDRADALRELREVVAVAGSAGLALSSLAAWLLAGAALRPVEQLRRTAATLPDTDPAARLPVPATGDELARLAATLNDLLGRMQAAREREHRFVDDASHELRTPLGVLKAELDLAAARPRSADELRDTLAAAAHETDRLARLAEDLLVLARARPGGLPLLRAPVRLGDLLEQVAGPLRPRARRAGRALTVHAADTLVEVDPVRVRQALHNLVENALTHGAGAVHVRAAAPAPGDGGLLVVRVVDEGAGVAPDLAPHAFQPFVRGAGRAPGTGLGLAVVAAVADAHGGTARLVGGGVVLELPLPDRAGPA